MNSDELRQEYADMMRREEIRQRRRLAARLTGWVLLLLALLAVTCVALRP